MSWGPAERVEELSAEVAVVAIVGLVAWSLAQTTAVCVAQIHRTRKRSAFIAAMCGRGPGWLPYLPLMLFTAVFLAAPPAALTEVPVRLAGVIIVVAILVRQASEGRATRSLLLQMTEQAMRDPLTGLANRALFEDRLTEMTQLHRSRGLPVAVIVVDLNGFKAVNDVLGHPAGDEVLRQAASRLRGTVRPGDTVARIGGDEFAVLVEGHCGNARAIAARISAAFQGPFAVAGTSVVVRPSLGVAAANSADVDVTGEGLVARADAAMYAAKRERSDLVSRYLGAVDAAGVS